MSCLQASNAMDAPCAAFLQGTLGSGFTYLTTVAVCLSGDLAANGCAPASVSIFCLSRFPGCWTDQQRAGQQCHDILRGHVDGAVCVSIPASSSLSLIVHWPMNGIKFLAWLLCLPRGTDRLTLVFLKSLGNHAKHPYCCLLIGSLACAGSRGMTPAGTSARRRGGPVPGNMKYHRC